MKHLLFLALLSLLAYSLWAQKTQPLTGRVVDEEGKAASYCNVLALCADSTVCAAVVTDLEGRFALTAPIEARWIAFRYVGYNEVLFAHTGAAVKR